jgi:hypothetical protein
MRVRNLSLSSIAALLAGIAGIGTASAGNVEIDNLGVYPGGSTTVTVTSPAYGPANPTTGLILLGTTTGETIPVFCVDLFHDIGEGSIGPYPYYTASVSYDNSDPSSPSGPGNGNMLSSMTSGEIQTLADIGAHEYIYDKSNPLLPDIETAIAGAIWTVEYNATVVAPDSTTQLLLDKYVTYAEAHPETFSLGLFPFGDTQGFANTQGFVVGVPEPSTWAMALMGFMGLGYAAFRRRGKREAIAG